MSIRDCEKEDLSANLMGGKNVHTHTHTTHHQRVFFCFTRYSTSTHTYHPIIAKIVQRREEEMSTDDVLREVEEMGKRALGLEEAVRAQHFVCICVSLLSVIGKNKRKNDATYRAIKRRRRSCSKMQRRKCFVMRQKEVMMTVQTD